MELKQLLNFSSNFIRNSNDETNFPRKSLLTNMQVSKICEAFANGLLANIKFSKTQLSKLVQLAGLYFLYLVYLICQWNPLNDFFH